MKTTRQARSGPKPRAGMSSFEEVNDRLGEQLTAAYRAVRDRARGESTSPRTAAYRIAIERVWKAIRLRGI